MRVRFLDDFDYTPSDQRGVTIAYPSGLEETVKRECGEAAIAAGKAVEIDAPPANDHSAPSEGPSPRAGRK